jgi:hypothetical protein
MNLPKSQSNYIIAIYFHSFEIFIIQIGEIGFCKPELFSSQIIFRMLKKANAFWMDFEALVREIDVRTLVLQSYPKEFAIVRERRFRALVLQNH